MRENAGLGGLRMSGLRLTSLCLGLVLLAGCEGSLTAADRVALSDAGRCVELGQYEPALTSLDRILREHDRAPEAAEAYYLRGLCRSRLGQMAPAANDFIQAADRGKDRRELEVKARASLAMIHYGWGNWDRAADLYARVVGELEDRPPTELILFYAGVSMQRCGRWAAGRVQLARILNTPALRERPIAHDAYAKAAWPYDYFAIQVGSFQDAPRAEAAVRAFAQRGLDTREEYRDATKRWLVLAGRYATYSEAQAALPYVRKFQADALVVP